MKIGKILALVVVGAIVIVFGIKWSVETYAERQQAKKIEAFLENYKLAEDKEVFLLSYDWSGKGLSVDLSTSVAYEESGESDDDKGSFTKDAEDLTKACMYLAQLAKTINEMRTSYTDAAVNLYRGSPPQDVQNGLAAFQNSADTLDSKWKKMGCKSLIGEDNPLNVPTENGRE